MKDVINREEMINDEFDVIDLRNVISILLRWKWLIIILTLTSIITAGILSFFVLPPVYEAKTTLLVTQGDTKNQIRYNENDLESVVGALSRLPEMTINTYVEQIKNPSILASTIAALELDELGYTPDGLGSLINVRALKDTNLIEIKVENTDPQLAANIANQLGNQVLTFISENNQEQMSKSVKFLQEQADTVQKGLVQATKELDKLESQPRSVDFLEQEKASKTSDLMELRSKYMQAQIDYQQLQVGQAQIEKRLSNIPATIIKVDPANPTIKEELPNPDYTQIKMELEAKQSAIAEKKAELDGMAGYIAKLEKEVGLLQGELIEKKATKTRLERQIADLENTYSLLSEKITQTQITKSINLGETSLQVMAKAMLPTGPIKPKKELNIAIAAVLGLMISVGLAFVMEFFDNTIRTKEDVEKKLNLPVLGAIPQYNSKTFKSAQEVNASGKGIATSDSYTS